MMPLAEDSQDDVRPNPPGKMTEGEVQAWQQIHIRDMWRIFRIMSEFVDGFDKLARLGPCVSVFGSARTKPGEPYYRMGEEVGRLLVKHDFGVITGGGPGIMEAANKGAREGGGKSIGLNIVVPHEQEGNPYVDRDKLINFNFFFVRKVMFVKYAMGFIVLPGGFGTMDELFESLTLIQTGKSTRFPVVLMGKSFWSGLVDWMVDSVQAAGNISAKDPDLF
ncbi:MAG: TIGR00730 family Rossman fold protein, partial [Rhodothermales bacterium]